MTSASGGVYPRRLDSRDKPGGSPNVEVICRGLLNKTEDDSRMQQRSASLDPFAADGEMSGRMRAHDWSATPLGPVDSWPPSLQIAVAILLHSRYAMWLGWGPDLTFFYNDAYAGMSLGARHPWALGRSAREVWPEIWEDISPRAESVVRTGKATWDERLLLFLERRGSPEETYHTFSYSPVPDGRGGVGGLLCVVTEETERAIGERRLRTLRELSARTTEEARSVEDACQTAARILGGDPHDLPFVLLYLLDADARTARLAGATGLSPGSAAAPSGLNFSTTGVPNTGWPLRAVLETGRAEVVTNIGPWLGSLPVGVYPEPPHTALVLPLLKSGQDRLAGFVVAGVSPRLPFDDDYRGFLDLLAGQVATAVANAQAYEEERKRAEALAELDRAKTTFFSNVSHEFRTPLALMLGPVEDALAETDEPLPPAQRGRLEIARRNALRLQRLVNTLLDFSRIEAGRVRAVFEPTDLAALTADLASNFRSACEKAGLRLIVDCPPLAEPVFVDRQMWEKVVLNLLSNAFKFTFEGEIAVSLRQAGRAAELQVRDTGTGIPPEEMPHLFERFHRVENSRGRTHEGSGIGLALVQELVKLHGGSIRAQSEVGRGTTFLISVPLGSDHLPRDQVGGGRNLVSTAPGASLFVEEALRWLPDGGPESTEWLTDPGTPVPPLLAPGQAEAGRPRVLVADDNADMRRYVARLLAGQYAVETVPDGAGALDAVHRQIPDLILSDVMMPRLDGFGLLRALRCDPRTAGVPVILLSARAGEESRVEGMQAGADDYLVKPFSARELLARISGLLQMARLRREASDFLHSSLNALSSHIAVLDDRGVILTVNDAWKRFADDNQYTGHNYGVGSNYLEACQPNSGECFEAVMRAGLHDVLSGRLPYFEHEYPCHSPTDRRWFVMRVTRFKSPEPVRVVVAHEDVTKRRLAEEGLREANRRKDEFLATLAHELRNPLAPIKNSLQILKMARLDRATAERTRGIMERQVYHLVRLVDDLLDVSRVMRGKVELRMEPVELATVVARAVETAQPLIETQGHELTIHLPAESLPLEADPVRLAQVVANLLTNAAKYTEPGGRITLTARREGDRAVLSVRDTGIGIAPDMLPKVFDLFVQVDHATTKTQGGLGIGLTLVKNLVEMHQGEVEARSAGLGQGSEFVVRLPLSTRTQPETNNQERDGRRESGLPAGHRLLVVDDNQDAGESLAMLLRLKGHEVRIVSDGCSALEVVKEYPPELIFLDIGMPGMDGYEVARRLRQQPGLESVRLVALTGWGQPEDRRRSKAAGFDSHLVKPPELKDLDALLTALKPQGRA
jgi:signal transduction histidine kinase/CheY-like chemotaxis protein